MSASLYEAALAFLEGDSGDVRASVNAELPGALVPGSVVAARAAKSRQQRRELAPPLTVEIVPGAWVAREIGIGFEERDLAFELKTTLRRKDASAGRAQLATVGEVARALLERYEAKSNLTITAKNALFRRSKAELLEIDEAPESHEIARSVVRVTFTFSRPLGDNT